MAAVWPTSTSEFARPTNEIPKVVFSTTLPLQLELFEGPRSDGDLLESSLHRVELLSDEEGREHEEDAERDDAGEDQDFHS